MAIWRHPVIAALARQLAYSPVPARTAQLRAARALVHTLETAKNYPWTFVHFRITGHRPREFADAVMDGATLLADLGTLIEHLSGTLDLPRSAAGEPVLDDRAIAARWGVSTKTVSRCRPCGLLAQRFIDVDGKRRIGYLESDVNSFTERHRAGVERSARLSQLSADERTRILALAQPLAEAGHRRGVVARRVAHTVGRAVETVRLTLLKHDRQHPDAALFDERGEPIKPLERAALVALHHSGLSVDQLAQRTGRTSDSIARAFRLERLDRLRQIPIPLVPNALFEHPDARAIITQTLPREALAHAQRTVAAGTNVKAFDPLLGRIPEGLPPDLRRLFMQPVMPVELEIDAFRRMNFLRFRARALQQQLAADGPQQDPRWDQLAALLAGANALKNQLVQANVRIAIHVARKHLRPGRALLELVSDATVFLMHAVDRFDFSRHVAFSTYATYVLMKNFARDRRDRLSAPDRMLVTGQEMHLSDLRSTEVATAGEGLDASAEQRNLRAAMDCLPVRERVVLTSRFGIGGSEDPQSLSALAERMGVTKTRVRQIETRALANLRRLMAADATPGLRTRAIATATIAG